MGYGGSDGATGILSTGASADLIEINTTTGVCTRLDEAASVTGDAPQSGRQWGKPSLDIMMIGFTSIINGCSIMIVAPPARPSRSSRA